MQQATDEREREREGSADERGGGRERCWKRQTGKRGGNKWMRKKGIGTRMVIEEAEGRREGCADERGRMREKSDDEQH